MIPLFKVYMSNRVDKPLLETIHSGWIGQCERNAEFEKALADRIGNQYCVTTSCCTHAIHLAYRLMGIGREDEVITTPLTCFCANTPIMNIGGKIVWADVNVDMNIDPKSIESSITNKTKAIYVMHWGGYPCNLEEIKDIADKYNLFLLEDAAHAFGSTYKNSVIGDCKYSDFTAFSFQAIKHLTCGDGGALFTRNIRDYKRGKLLRWYGIDREGEKSTVRCEDDILEWGYKYHMNDIASVIGLNNLPDIDNIQKLVKENVEYYKEELHGIDGISFMQTKTDRTSVNWLFTVLVDRKQDFCKMMNEKGIATSDVHARNDNNTCTIQYVKKLPILEWVLKRYTCIPCGWWVMKEDREYIIDCIKGGW